MRKTLTLSIILLVSRECLIGADASDSENKTDILDGKYVYRLGTKFNNPLLRLIGKTFLRNEQQLQIIIEKQQEQLKQQTTLEKQQEQHELQQKTTLDRLCELHPCMEWGSWSTCPGTKGQFAMVTRSRNCSKTDTCPQTRPENLITTESKVCEGASECPSSYETEGLFCLKLYSTAKTKAAAKLDCKADGGYVVHIDTKLKSDSVHATLTRHGFTGVIYINGERNVTGGPWYYEYGSEPTLDNWLPGGGEPSNGSDELCKVDLMSSNRVWYDRSCTKLYAYVCEIII